MLCQCKKKKKICDSLVGQIEERVKKTLRRLDGHIFVSRLGRKCENHMNVHHFPDNLRIIILLSAAKLYFEKGAKLAVRNQGSTTIHVCAHAFHQILNLYTVYFRMKDKKRSQ